MPKIGRNEPCPCESGKKYKKCCIGRDIEKKEKLRQRIIYGDEYISKQLETFADYLKSEFPDHQVIDVSKVADNDTYRPLQIQHYKTKVIMLLERTPENDEVFLSRCPSHVKYMVLYHGAYQAFETNENVPIELQLEKVCEMINTRIQEQVWEKN